MLIVFLITLLILSLIGIGIGIWLLIRAKSKLTKPDIKVYDISIHLSPKTQQKITSVMIDEWYQEMMRRWRQNQTEYTTIPYPTGIYIQLDDTAYYVSNTNQKMAGYTYIDEKRCFLSTIGENGLINIDRIRNLFIHEVSHIIYAQLSKDYNGESHHDYFKKIGV